jgi:hypothetical protein
VTGIANGSTAAVTGASSQVSRSPDVVFAGQPTRPLHLPVIKPSERSSESFKMPLLSSVTTKPGQTPLRSATEIASQNLPFSPRITHTSTSVVGPPRHGEETSHNGICDGQAVSPPRADRYTHARASKFVSKSIVASHLLPASRRLQMMC